MILGYREIGCDADPSAGCVSHDAFFRHVCALRTYEVVPFETYDPGDAKHAVIVLVEPDADTLAYARTILGRFGFPFECASRRQDSPEHPCRVEIDTDGRAHLSRPDATLLAVRWMAEGDSLFRAKVAVIITNYNYGHLLREAVASIDSQIVGPDEFLIVDDASTDGSSAVLDALQAEGRTVIRNAHNLGIVENFRSCVERTSSDYVMFLGADNRLRSDYILECRLALDADPTVAVAYTDMLLFGVLAGDLARKVGAELIGHAPASNWNVFEWRFPDPTPEVLTTFRDSNFVHGSSMYRRSAYESVGGYRHGDGPEDHNLFYRIWQNGGGLAHVALPLLEYRQHSVAQANNLSALQVENAGLKAQIRDWEQNFSIVEASHSSLDAEIKRLNAAFAALDAEMQRISEAYGDQTTELQRVVAAYAERNNEVVRVSEAYGNQTVELQRVVTAYAEQNAELLHVTATCHTQASQLREVESERSAAWQRLETNTGRLAAIQDEVERQRGLAEELTRQLQEARRRDYISRAARTIHDWVARFINRRVSRRS